MTDEQARAGYQTATAYLRELGLLLLCVGVAVVVMAVRGAVQESRGRMTARRNDRAALAWIWSTFVGTFWLFSYVVISPQPKGGYADLLGPSWITTPILLAVNVFTFPLLVLLIGSIVERTNSRLVTKLSALVVLYVYGVMVVDYTTVPLDLPPGLQSEPSHLPGPKALGVLLAGGFVLEYVVRRVVALRVGRRRGEV